MNCAVHTEEDKSINIDVNRKPTHTAQYLQFDSHHPLEQKQGVIRTLNHRSETMPTKTEGKEKEQKHIRGALKTYVHLFWPQKTDVLKEDSVSHRVTL